MSRTFWVGLTAALALFGMYFLPTLPVFFTPEKKAEIEAGAGSQNLYGTPAQPDYDFEREDRSILVRVI